MKTRGLGALVIVACALGCAEEAPPRAAGRAIAAGCVIDSDCADELACVFERCRPRCDTSRDCAAGLRCVRGEPPKTVCQLPDEVQCQRTPDCPGAQICALDDRCRDECISARDCVSPQVCVRGTCAEESELVGSVLVTPPPTQASVACQYASECPPGQICREGLCGAACVKDRDCAIDEVCVVNACRPATVTAPRCAVGDIAFCTCGEDARPGTAVCEDPSVGFGACVCGAGGAGGAAGAGGEGGGVPAAGTAGASGGGLGGTTSAGSGGSGAGGVIAGSGGAPAAGQGGSAGEAGAAGASQGGASGQAGSSGGFGGVGAAGGAGGSAGAGGGAAQGGGGGSAGAAGAAGSAGAAPGLACSLVGAPSAVTYLDPAKAYGPAGATIEFGELADIVADGGDLWFVFGGGDPRLVRTDANGLPKGQEIRFDAKLDVRQIISTGEGGLLVLAASEVNFHLPEVPRPIFASAVEAPAPAYTACPNAYPGVGEYGDARHLLLRIDTSGAKPKVAWLHELRAEEIAIDEEDPLPANACLTRATHIEVRGPDILTSVRRGDFETAPGGPVLREPTYTVVYSLATGALASAPVRQIEPLVGGRVDANSSLIGPALLTRLADGNIVVAGTFDAFLPMTGGAFLTVPFPSPSGGQLPQGFRLVRTGTALRFAVASEGDRGVLAIDRTADDRLIDVFARKTDRDLTLHVSRAAVTTGLREQERARWAVEGDPSGTATASFVGPMGQAKRVVVGALRGSGEDVRFRVDDARYARRGFFFGGLADDGAFTSPRYVSDADLLATARLSNGDLVFLVYASPDEPTPCVGGVSPARPPEASPYLVMRFPSIP